MDARQFRTRSIDRLSCTASIALSLLVLAGCATTPYVGQGPNPQIIRGHPIPPVDFIGNVFALPVKLLLWDWRVDNHSISADTEAVLDKFLSAHLTEIGDTKFRLNVWAPQDDVKRLVHNHRVAWPYRATFGVLSIVVETVLPSRLFGGLLGGDSYNPFTNTVSLYSDHPAIALHEAGHALDFSDQKRQGTYAMARILPFVDLAQEHEATTLAIDYLMDVGDQHDELEAYKILYPAYGTYVGGYMPGPFGIGSFVAVLAGHVLGRARAREQAQFYESLHVSSQPTPTSPQASPSSAAVH